jgi:hypothetical protein
MSALAFRSKSPTPPHAYLRRKSVPPQPGGLRVEPAPEPAEPPAETDAWWLSRSPAPSFSRKHIALPDACGRALCASGVALGRLVVEFNGATFDGAALAENDGRYELDPGAALAREMADVLDEDDGLDVELLPGRGRPTLALHPYIRAL